MIGWNHFIRGRLSTTFSSIIHKYYSTNKLGNKFKVSSWYRKLTVSLFQIHSTSWNTFCSSIYIAPTKEIQPPAKESLIILIHKYYKKCTELPATKRKWFSRKLIQYEKWSISELQKWIRVARRIIRKNNQLQNNIRKLTSTIINDNKQTNKQVRTINHKIVPPIPLEDLYKRKSTTITLFFHSNPNKIVPSTTYKTYRHNNICQHKSIQTSQVNNSQM